MNRDRPYLLALLLPLAATVVAFFLLPMGRLVVAGSEGEEGWMLFLRVFVEWRYLEVLISTVVLSLATTAIALFLATVSGLFLQRNRFPGRSFLVAMLTFPLAFPGVVIGFLVILLAGRQGLIGEITQALAGEKVVFAYSAWGLLFGYVYFSVPRVMLTVMAAVEKLDPALEEAARSLGARPLRVFFDVILPGIRPALIASGAIAFATAMGAFGTAFTLATKIDVLPMLIYTEFTLNANFAMAAALSVVLGIVTWLALSLGRSLAGQGVAAGG